MRRLFLAAAFVSVLPAQELKQNESPSVLLTYDEAIAYCKEEPGWRLPTVAELFVLVHDRSDVILHKSHNYWSGTQFFADNALAWQVLNPDRDVKPIEKNKKLNALCVKDTPLKEDLRNRYELQNGMIKDNKQHLYWQVIGKKERRNRFSHPAAATYCATLTTNSLQWRLPTLKELFGIIEFKRFDPALDKNIFTYTYPKYYWTADQLGDYSNEAYVVGFKVGSVAQSSKVNESFVRCVSEGKQP